MIALVGLARAGVKLAAVSIAGQVAQRQADRVLKKAEDRWDLKPEVKDGIRAVVGLAAGSAVGRGLNGPKPPTASARDLAQVVKAGAAQHGVAWPAR